MELVDIDYNINFSSSVHVLIVKQNILEKVMKK